MIMVGRVVGIAMVVAGLVLALPQVFVDKPYQAMFVGGVLLAICGAALLADLWGMSEEDFRDDR